MYYLQSRYYDPEIGRFINADSTDYLGATGTLLSYNLFAYCENDPVNYIDATGNTTIYSGYTEWSLPNDDTFFYDANETVNTSDKINWKIWGTVKSVVKPLYPDGVKFYEHFRSNSGRILRYNYKKAYKEDKKIKASVDYLINLIKTWASLFRKKNFEYYYMSSEMIDVNASTMNWKLALGGHDAGIRAKIRYNPKRREYTMYYEIVAYDRYNFDKKDSTGDIKDFYGIPDEWNGRFVTLGWAKFFTSVGIMKGKLVWKEQRTKEN